MSSKEKLMATVSEDFGNKHENFMPKDDYKTIKESEFLDSQRKKVVKKSDIPLDAYRLPMEGEAPVHVLQYSKSMNFEELPAEYPERISVSYTNFKSCEKVSYFQQAMKYDDLKWTLLGSTAALITKGHEGVVNVVDVLSPALITGANFYCSEHGNWHVGTGGKDSVTELQELNAGNYSYFQNRHFFLAITKMEEKNGYDQLLLFIHKKPEPDNNEPRAQQD